MQLVPNSREMCRNGRYSAAGHVKLVCVLSSVVRINDNYFDDEKWMSPKAHCLVEIIFVSGMKHASAFCPSLHFPQAAVKHCLAQTATFALS